MWYFYNLSDKPLVVLTDTNVHILRAKESLELPYQGWQGFIAQCGKHRITKQYAASPKFALVVGKSDSLECFIPHLVTQKEMEKESSYYLDLVPHPQTGQSVPYGYQDTTYCEEEGAYVNQDFVKALDYLDPDVLWDRTPMAVK